MTFEGVRTHFLKYQPRSQGSLLPALGCTYTGYPRFYRFRELGSFNACSLQHSLACHHPEGLMSSIRAVSVTVFKNVI